MINRKYRHLPLTISIFYLMDAVRKLYPLLFALDLANSVLGCELLCSRFNLVDFYSKREIVFAMLALNQHIGFSIKLYDMMNVHFCPFYAVIRGNACASSKCRVINY